jgi:uncharacterized membrane protein
MKKVLLAALVVMLTIAVVNPALAASRGSRFVPMGEEPLAMFPLSQAIGISGDGEVALVCLGFIGCGASVWSEGAEGQFDTSYTVIEGITGGLPGISDTYEVLLTPGSLEGAAGIWDGVPFPNAGYDPIVPLADGFALCGNSGQSVYAFSGDGQWATGLTWIDRDGNGNGCDGASAFLWDRAANTTTELDNSVNDDSTRGNALNDDGSVIVGWGQTNQREAMKWVDGVQTFICPDPIGAGGENFCSEGWDVSGDGQSILTSFAGPGEFTTTAAVVDPALNVTKMDPPPFPGDPFFDAWNARALRADGGAVVGSYGGSGFFGSPPYPTLWQPDTGTIDLQVMLLGQGLDDLFFWFLSSANDISDDGKKIVGYGTNPNGWIEAWLVDISKVKVCHKPDGNARTIAINWDSVGDHLAHGDDLSTCEFAAADGRSRAAERLLRGIPANTSADNNNALVSPQQLQQLEAVGANAYEGASPLWTVDENGSPKGKQISQEEREQRIRSLADRVRRGAIRN